MKTATHRRYRPTEAKYKGGAQELYVTYDLAQETRGGRQAVYPKVKRVYIAGRVKDWEVGDFARRTGRKVHGVKIDYEQRRAAYERKGYTAQRDGTRYRVPPARVPGSTSRFSQVVEVPRAARNVRLHTGRLPRKYHAALQAVR